ncbi:hypothetical protein Tco_1451933 [Tanacetum coccineum]
MEVVLVCGWWRLRGWGSGGEDGGGEDGDDDGGDEVAAGEVVMEMWCGSGGGWPESGRNLAEKRWEAPEMFREGEEMNMCEMGARFMR